MVARPLQWADRKLGVSSTVKAQTNRFLTQTSVGRRVDKVATKVSTVANRFAGTAVGRPIASVARGLGVFGGLQAGIAAIDMAKDHRRYNEQLRQGKFDATLYDKTRWYNKPTDLFLGHGTTDHIANAVGAEYRACVRRGNSLCRTGAVTGVATKVGTAVYSTVEKGVKKAVAACSVTVGNCAAAAGRTATKVAGHLWEAGKGWVVDTGKVAKETGRDLVNWATQCTWFASSASRASCKARQETEARNEQRALAQKDAELASARHKRDLEWEKKHGGSSPRLPRLQLPQQQPAAAASSTSSGGLWSSIKSSVGGWFS